MKKITIIFPVFFCLLSCKDISQNRKTAAKPIILGDSSTIVTETDSQYLSDLVKDLEIYDIAYKNNNPIDTSSISKQQQEEKISNNEENKEEATNSIPSQNQSGFNINFSNIKLTFTGIEAKELKKQNTEKAQGLSYLVTSGDINQSNIVVEGARSVKIRQRYQTSLGLKSNLGTLSLDNLGKFISSWTNLQSQQKGNINHTILKDKLASLSFHKVSNSNLRNATEKELRKNRAKNSEIQSWLKEIRNTKAITDKPCVINLIFCEWQISGVNTKGKSFQKTIRLDL